MLVFSLVTRWIENVEERENKRMSMEKYQKNEEDREKSVQMRRTFLKKEMKSVYLLSACVHELTLSIL
jgi:hypothetical protein